MNHIVLITIDSLRYDHTSIANYKRDTTPTLRYLSNKGILLKNHYSNAPYTMASIYTILSSMYPLVPNFEYYRIPYNSKLKNVPNLVSILKRRRYKTILVHSNPWFDIYGFNKLFDVNIDPYHEGYDKATIKTDLSANIINSIRNIISINKLNKVIYNNKGLLRLKALTYSFLANVTRKNIRPYATSDILNLYLETILKRLTKTSDRSGFFVWIHYMDVHEPYIPQKQIFGKKLSIDNVLYLMELRIRSPKFLTKSERERIIDLYDSCIYQIDSAINDLLKILEQYMDFDKTLILITSDHGESLGERGVYGHGGSGRKVMLYEELIKVPFIILAPNYLAHELSYILNKNANMITSHISVVPTLCSLLNIKTFHKFMGIDLTSKSIKIKGNSMSNAFMAQAIQATDPNHPTNLNRAKNKVLVAYRYMNYKIIIDWRNNIELYDLETDPLEKLNIARSNPELIKKMLLEINKLLNNISRYSIKLKTKLLKDRLKYLN